MLKRNKIMIGLMALSSGVLFAGTMGPVDQFKQTGYIKLGSGGSFAMKSTINPNLAQWDAAPQGYSSTLGNTALYSAAFGLNFSPLLSGDIEYIYRPSFSYSKFQTSTAAGTLNFLGTKTRKFSLESNSLLANIYLHGGALSDRLKYSVYDHFTIQPFVGGGIGVGFNTVSDFHSLQPDGSVATMLPDLFKTSFAWQLSAGLELLSEGPCSLAAGYRYYNGGTYKSNYYSYDFKNSATPWTSTLQSNEFFVTFSYKLNV